MLGLQAIVIGILATMMMDILGYGRGQLLAVKGLNYGWLGRWVIGWKNLQFQHSNITQSAAQPGETALGWILHYVTGVLWAGLLLIIFPTWLADLSMLPALLVGLVTLAFPFLIMQPAFGFGFFASKTPKPLLAMKNSLISHLFFAVGLYAAGWVSRGFI